MSSLHELVYRLSVEPELRARFYADPAATPAGSACRWMRTRRLRCKSWPYRRPAAT